LYKSCLTAYVTTLGNFSATVKGCRKVFLIPDRVLGTFGPSVPGGLLYLVFKMPIRKAPHYISKRGNRQAPANQDVFLWNLYTVSDLAV
jgi:hypothetical protein